MAEANQDRLHRERAAARHHNDPLYTASAMRPDRRFIALLPGFSLRSMTHLVSALTYSR